MKKKTRTKYLQISESRNKMNKKEKSDIKNPIKSRLAKKGAVPKTFS